VTHYRLKRTVEKAKARHDRTNPVRQMVMVKHSSQVFAREASDGYTDGEGFINVAPCQLDPSVTASGRIAHRSA
jgi:hypothetical protein